MSLAGFPHGGAGAAPARACGMAVLHSRPSAPARTPTASLPGKHRPVIDIGRFPQMHTPLFHFRESSLPYRE